MRMYKIKFIVKDFDNNSAGFYKYLRANNLAHCEQIINVYLEELIPSQDYDIQNAQDVFRMFHPNLFKSINMQEIEILPQVLC